MSNGNSKQRPGSTAPGGAASGGASVKPDSSGAPSAADPKAAGSNQSGRVKFDERGNAVWEWSVATGAFGREVSTDRMKKLENSALSLAEDSPTPVDVVKSNPHGTVKGYNPYDSGKLGSTREAPKKTDLRKLGDWLKLKKQVANKKDDD
jgi:hypothetical protein